MDTVFYLCLLLPLVGVARAFPSGAPFDTCLAMFPKHNNLEQQIGPAPFQVDIQPPTYQPGDNVTVTVRAMAGHVIKGVQVRAHRAQLNKEWTVGTFLQWPEDKVQPLNCFGQPHNMITHRNGELRSEIVLVWNAPEDNLGPIIFKVTIVERFEVFWSQLKSPVLQSFDPGTVVVPDQVEPEANASFVAIEWERCGLSQGCLLYPRHCSGHDCHAALTFARDAHGYTFHLVAHAEGYVSVGFSHDTYMGEDQTVSCTAQGDRVTVQNGYNHRTYNERMMAVGLTGLYTGQKDGKVHCRFTRPETMDVVVMPTKEGPAQVVAFDLAVDFYVFLAWGYTYEDSDAMKKHQEMPIISDSKINFRHYVIYRGSSIPLYPRVHGCLMVTAWMAVAGLTVVLSRHFREGAGATFCLGGRTWFLLHRLCAILLFCLTAAGLFTILVHLEWKITEKEDAYSHACVGFTVVALVCAQLLMGILRPPQDSKVRVIFNVLHRLLGKGAQILSVASVALAVQWDWLPGPARLLGLVVVCCWAGLQLLAEVALEIHRRCCSYKREAVDLNLDGTDPQEKGEARPDPSSVPILLYGLLALALACAGLCTILLF